MKKLLSTCLLSLAFQCNACEIKDNSIQECLDIIDRYIYGDYTPKEEKVCLLLETALMRIMIQDNQGMHEDMEYLYLLCEKYPECMYRLKEIAY